MFLMFHEDKLRGLKHGSFLSFLSIFFNTYLFIYLKCVVLQINMPVRNINDRITEFPDLIIKGVSVSVNGSKLKLHSAAL